AEHGYARPFKPVDDPRGQRAFGSHDNKPNMFFPGKGKKRLRLGRTYINTRGYLRNTAVAGGTEQGTNLWRLRKLPHKGMLPTPAAYNENPHFRFPPNDLSEKGVRKWLCRNPRS